MTHNGNMTLVPIHCSAKSFLKSIVIKYELFSRVFHNYFRLVQQLINVNYEGDKKKLGLSMITFIMLIGKLMIEVLFGKILIHITQF
jgi:hypothetical protein